MSLCLILQSGCSTDPLITRIVEKQYPPEIWLSDCLEPGLQGVRNRDLLRYTMKLKGALAKCNEDKSALREWVRAGEGNNSSE